MSQPLTDAELAEEIRGVDTVALQLTLPHLRGDSKEAAIIRKELASR